MEFQLVWGGDPEDLLVTMVGAAGVDEVGALREALADPRWHPGMRVLLDERLVDWSGMSARDIERRAEVLTEVLGRLGRYHTAVVLGKGLDFGMVRMEQALIAEHVPGEVEVFRSLEEARAWLRQSGSEGDPGGTLPDAAGS